MKSIMKRLLFIFLMGTFFIGISYNASALGYFDKRSIYVSLGATTAWKENITIREKFKLSKLETSLSEEVGVGLTNLDSFFGIYYKKHHLKRGDGNFTVKNPDSLYMKFIGDYSIKFLPIGLYGATGIGTTFWNSVNSSSSRGFSYLLGAGVYMRILDHLEFRLGYQYEKLGTYKYSNNSKIKIRLHETLLSTSFIF